VVKHTEGKNPTEDSAPRLQKAPPIPVTELQHSQKRGGDACFKGNFRASMRDGLGTGMGGAIADRRDAQGGRLTKN